MEMRIRALDEDDRLHLVLEHTKDSTHERAVSAAPADHCLTRRSQTFRDDNRIRLTPAVRASPADAPLLGLVFGML